MLPPFCSCTAWSGESRPHVGSLPSSAPPPASHPALVPPPHIARRPAGRSWPAARASCCWSRRSLCASLWSAAPGTACGWRPPPPPSTSGRWTRRCRRQQWGGPRRACSRRSRRSSKRSSSSSSRRNHHGGARLCRHPPQCSAGAWRSREVRVSLLRGRPALPSPLSPDPVPWTAGKCCSVQQHSEAPHCTGSGSHSLLTPAPPAGAAAPPPQQQRPAVSIPGLPPLRHASVLTDRRHVLSEDEEGRVQLWDITAGGAKQRHAACVPGLVGAGRLKAGRGLRPAGARAGCAARHLAKLLLVAQLHEVRKVWLRQQPISPQHCLPVPPRPPPLGRRRCGARLRALLPQGRGARALPAHALRLALVHARLQAGCAAPCSAGRGGRAVHAAVATMACTHAHMLDKMHPHGLGASLLLCSQCT